MAVDLVPEAMMEAVAQRFKLLGESTRLHLLNLLHTEGELPVQSLVERSGHQQANVSKHLGLMAKEGLVARRRDGLNVYYRIADPTVASLCMLVISRLRQEALEQQTRMMTP